MDEFGGTFRDFEEGFIEFCQIVVVIVAISHWYLENDEGS